MTPSYPIFSPPADLAAKPHRTWTKSEAQRYFDWLMTQSSERTDQLLEFLGLEAFTLDRELLVAAGRRVGDLLSHDGYSSTTSNGRRELTNHGHSLAADMGLLTARVIQAHATHAVKWSIMRRPKSDLSYNLPVLAGFGKLSFDPVGGSITEAKGILRGIRDSDIWAKTYDHWLQRV